MGDNRELIDLHGPFSGSAAVAAQVLTAGQLRGPKVQRLFHDVYVLTGTKVTHELRCRAAALILPPDAVITGRSAATLRGIPLAWPSDPVDVVIPEQRRITRRTGFAVRRRGWEPHEREPWNGVGLATPDRTALDLLLDRELPGAVADLDAVLRAGLVDEDVVRSMVARRSDRGIIRARRAVELADARAESRPESSVRVHLVLAGLAPEPQFWIEDETGRIARVDLAFPEAMVAVEYDGDWRDGQLWALNKDRERLNRVQAAGWEVVFVTAALLRDPERMVRTIRAALTRRPPNLRAS